MKKFVYKNYDSFWDFIDWDLFIQSFKLKIFSKMSSYVSGFFSSEKMKKIIQYPLLFLGTSPYEAPAIYNIMSHVDFNMGVFYPQG
jgi:phytoene desaturase